MHKWHLTLVPRETFVRGCRQFARTVEKGIDQVDPDCSFILPPGKTQVVGESEEEGGGAMQAGAVKCRLSGT